jgi:hydrogenase maturation protease
MPLVVVLVDAAGRTVRVEARLAMKTHDNNRIVMIGLGNSLRGDDGVGRRVVERVAARDWPQVISIAVTQLVPELATLVASARAVIFVDACVDQEAVEVRELTPACPFSRRFHGTGPRELLALTRSCYNRAPLAWLVMVPGRDFGFTDQLSAAAEQHVATAVGEVEQLIERLSASEANHA